ncbi:MAG: hypothetical protein R2712_04335 [Vicinamibacterales bacterium]
MFFDKETFGHDRLVAGDPRDPAFLAEAPLTDPVKRDPRLLTERTDPMAGMSMADKKARLARMIYAEFVTRELGLDPGAWRTQTRTHGLFGVGVDAARPDAAALGLPGFAGMGLDEAAGPGQNYDSIHHESRSRATTSTSPTATPGRPAAGPRTVPAALPGSTAADVVTARADYASSTWSRRAGAHPPEQPRAEGGPCRVGREPPGRSRLRPRWCAPAGHRTRRGPRVLAYGIVPATRPDLPAPQKQAMDYAIKVPLVYTNVFIRQWTAFQKVCSVSMPGMWHTSVGPPGKRRRLPPPDQSRRADRPAPGFFVGGVQAGPADTRAAPGRTSRAPRDPVCRHRAQHPRFAGPRPSRAAV